MEYERLLQEFFENEEDDFLLATWLQKYENENENQHIQSNHSRNSDFQLALELHKQLNGAGDTPIKKKNLSKDVGAPELELSDPNPDIWQLMRDFDTLFFNNTLSQHCVELGWSKRMTSVAGYCSWNPQTK